MRGYHSLQMLQIHSDIQYNPKWSLCAQPSVSALLPDSGHVKEKPRQVHACGCCFPAASCAAALPV